MSFNQFIEDLITERKENQLLNNSETMYNCIGNIIRIGKPLPTST